MKWNAIPTFTTLNNCQSFVFILKAAEHSLASQDVNIPNIFIQHLAGFCFWEQALFCVFTAVTPFPISLLSTSQLHLLLQIWAYEDTVMQHKLIFESLRLSKQPKPLEKSFAKYSDENKEFCCSTIDHSTHELFQVRKTCHSFSHDYLGGYSSYQSWVPKTSQGLWGFNFHASETRLWINLGGTIKVLPKKNILISLKWVW